MFEDLIKTKKLNKKIAIDAADDTCDQAIYDLLMDVEEVFDELHYLMLQNGTCVWCSSGKGERHDDKCFFLITSKRVGAELDNRISKN